MAAAFPGMGAPLVGLPAADEAFAAFTRASGVDVARLATDADDRELHRDRSWELAVVATEVAALQAHRAAGGKVSAALGFSIGAYAALASAGVATIAQIVRMIDIVLDASLALGDAFAMLALTGVPVEAIHEVCRPGDLELAAVIVPGQYLLAGREAAVHTVAARLGPQALAARVLPVRWPLHTSMMAPAATALEHGRPEVGDLLPARVPVYSAVDGGRIETPQEAWRLLVDHLVRPQVFDRAFSAAHEGGLRRCVELGPGDSLSRAVRFLTRGEIAVDAFPARGTSSTGGRTRRC